MNCAESCLLVKGSVFVSVLRFKMVNYDLLSQSVLFLFHNS